MKPAEKAGLVLMILSAPGITHGDHWAASLILFLCANAVFMFGGSIGVKHAGEDSQP